jgi:hypothetical protein
MAKIPVKDDSKPVPIHPEDVDIWCGGADAIFDAEALREEFERFKQAYNTNDVYVTGPLMSTVGPEEFDGKKFRHFFRISFGHIGDIQNVYRRLAVVLPLLETVPWASCWVSLPREYFNYISSF